MTAPLPPLPASLSRAETLSPGDLDARILQVEQRLIAREENLRRGVTALNRQVSEALQPRRLVKPALIAAGVVAALVLLRPRRAAEAPQGVMAQTAAVARPALIALLAGLPWVRLLSMAWPLLPTRLRGRVTPETAGSFMTVGLPLVESLLVRRRRSKAQAGR